MNEISDTVHDYLASHSRAKPVTQAAAAPYAGVNGKCKEFAQSKTAENPNLKLITYQGPWTQNIYTNEGLLAGQRISDNGFHAGALDPASGIVYDNNFPGGTPLTNWVGDAYSVPAAGGLPVSFAQSEALEQGVITVYP